MSGLGTRIGRLNWDALRDSLDDCGYAVTPPIADGSECADLAALFDRDTGFRKVIDMRRYRYGAGTYKYFDYPLPQQVQQLREALYKPLAQVANDWAARLRVDRT